MSQSRSIKHAVVLTTALVCLTYAQDMVFQGMKRNAEALKHYTYQVQRTVASVLYRSSISLPHRTFLERCPKRSPCP